MRIQRKREPNHKDKRVIEKFLIFPKTINYETRFLEKVKIVQEYNYYEWVDRKWVDTV